jgi:hypothetical protein
MTEGATISVQNYWSHTSHTSLRNTNHTNCHVRGITSNYLLHDRYEAKLAIVVIIILIIIIIIIIIMTASVV